VQRQFPAGDGNPTLSKIRRKLKEKIESEKLFNLPILKFGLMKRYLHKVEIGIAGMYV